MSNYSLSVSQTGNIFLIPILYSKVMKGPIIIVMILHMLVFMIRISFIVSQFIT